MSETMSKTKPQTSYSEAFKQRAVKLSQQPDKTIIQVAEELGISKSALTCWRKDAGVSRPNALLHKNNHDMTLEEHNRLLQHQLREKQMELDILKKAAMFFAKEST